MALECVPRIAVGNTAVFKADEDAPLSGDSYITVEDNKPDFTNESQIESKPAWCDIKTAVFWSWQLRRLRTSAIRNVSSLPCPPPVCSQTLLNNPATTIQTAQIPN